MASDITPGNIDGTFPIAGIDNDSQGFRTNFTNTSTNLSEAKAEIEDLQNKAILKSPLTGDSVTDNDMLGEVLQAATLLDTRETIFAHGTLTGPVPLDHQSGQFQTVTSSGSLVVSFVNFPTTTFGRVRLEVTITNIAHTVTIPSTVTIGVDSVRGLSGQIITFAATGTYVFDFTSDDGVANWTIIDVTPPPGDTFDLIFDTTPQLGGQLDVNGNAIGDGTLELITFTETASAVNQIDIANAATTNGPTISVVGDDTDVDLNIVPKGTGKTVVTALEAPMGINAVVAAAYETVLADAGIMVTLSDGGANTITIPANSAVAYPIGTQLNFQQAGAGTTTIAITTDTLNSAGSLFDLNGQFAVATALKMTATTWTLFGNLA